MKELIELKEKLQVMVDADSPSEQRTLCETCHLELAELGKTTPYLTDKKLLCFITFGMEGYCNCEKSKTTH